MTVKIDKGRALSSLSLTPLIDIVFLLLIFFLVATRFAEEEHEMDVQLPEASEVVPLAHNPKQIEVGIDKQGSFFLRHRQINAQQLEAELFRAARNNPGRQSVKIRADKRCPWQSVVTVMNLCRKAGIRDYTPTME